jgi:hypothetical protein
LKKLGFYVLIAATLYALATVLTTPCALANYAIRTLLLLLFIGIILKKDVPLKQIPYLNRFFK